MIRPIHLALALYSVLALSFFQGCSRKGPDGAVESKVGSHGPQGLFFMTKYWIATRNLEKAVWYFAPDGRVFQNLTEGLTADDLAKHTGPKGTWKLAGDNLEVAWSDGQKSSSTFEHKKGETGFAWDTGLFAPVGPFKNAASVAGSYEGGESVGGGGNFLAVARSMELKADGTYSSEGVSSFTATSTVSQVGGGGQSGQKGKWSLAGHTITLTGDDGTARRMIAFPYDDEKTPVYPDRMFLGGMMYKRR